MYKNDIPYTCDMYGAATRAMATRMNVYVAMTVTNAKTATTTDTVNNVDMCIHTTILSQTTQA